MYAFVRDTYTRKSLATSALIAAACAERRAWPPGPFLLIGDLNAQPEQIPYLREQLEQGTLYDVGA
eukprot:7785844-Alexandrium_andersonii.AAC.1